MELKEALKLALQSLWANKMRTVLTLIGVVIGVASVIAVVTLVNGANAFVDQKLTKQGSDVFTVSKQPRVITSFDEYTKTQKRKILEMSEYQSLLQHCQRCKAVGAMQTTSGMVKYGTDSVTQVSLRGWTASMIDLYNLNVVQGRAFTPSEEEHASHVALIGSDIQENLLKGEDPVGKEIRVDGTPYTIIGVGEKQGKSLGNSQDNWVAFPITAFQKSYGSQKTITIYARGGGAGEALERAAEEGRSLLRAIRHDKPGAEDSFTLETNDAFATLFKSITAWFADIAVPVACISLIVGGIVIMNIMLVSVTERTREIGIRKALGARKKDIMRQFLIESGIMSTAGGIIGVISGVAVAYGVTLLLGFPASVAVWSVLVGLLVSTSVGIFFGVYPARKAAELDPIVALRSEL